MAVWILSHMNQPPVLLAQKVHRLKAPENYKRSLFLCCLCMCHHATFASVAVHRLLPSVSALLQLQNYVISRCRTLEVSWVLLKWIYMNYLFFSERSLTMQSCNQSPNMRQDSFVAVLSCSLRIISNFILITPHASSSIDSSFHLLTS